MTAESVRDALERDAEPDDDAPDDDAPEPEPEPEPDDAPDVDPESAPAEPVEPDMGKIIAQLDKENARHEKRLGEIMGDDFPNFDPCPLCDQPGYVLPFQPGTEHGEIKRAMVDAYFGASGPQLEHATHTETCPKCDGYGELVSGSKRPEAMTVPCPDCGALGWRTVAAPAAPAAQYQPVAGEIVPQSVNANGPAEPDVWGRPAGHRHYGMPPSMVT